jgi:hypothetical protein
MEQIVENETEIIQSVSKTQQILSLPKHINRISMGVFTGFRICEGSYFEI